MVWAEWNESQVPGALNCIRQGTLVLGANARLATGLNLPTIRHVPPEPIGFLVVDVLDVIYAEAADLAPTIVSWPAAAPASETAATAARTSSRPTASGPASGGARTAGSGSHWTAWPGTWRSTGSWSGGRWSVRLCCHCHSPCLYVVLTLDGFCWAVRGMLPSGLVASDLTG